MTHANLLVAVDDGSESDSRLEDGATHTSRVGQFRAL